MKILIIGGNGFIGPFLCKELIHLGHEIAIFNRGNILNNLYSSDIMHIKGDQSQLMDYKSAFKAFEPQVVIHMIAYSEQDAQIAMKTFDGVTGRIVVLSSMDIYQAYGNLIRLEDAPTIQVPIHEDAPMRTKLYPYGGDYEKLLVEKTIMSNPNHLPGTVLRLPMVYGEEDPSHRLYKYVQRMLDNRRGIILDDQFANWRSSRGYVENVAHAIALVATNERANNRIYNVGDDGFTEQEWVQQIAKAMDWTGKVYSIPRKDLPEPLIYSSLDMRQDWVIDTSRIRHELNYTERVSVQDAIKRTVIWEANHPPKELHPKDFPRFDYELEDCWLASLA
ncbi:NAD-dependent epimerase/dehydratase family protein [Paenibacillus xylaniclasticus]|uniref:NAD-dependent epimerase/dehydratase family protein n=1 Tax=Paenibacillus xylaniclasticus TaxID=588083 RepID=UPI000FDCA4A3|nr:MULTISPECIES: NAD-dependent epimerase/dehydratase family protein [Paenibacillus]GFN30732.1 hypothetical protein PCURB6_09920 [Paenibacillus curdlanolyticus]